jgi:hypothetical protein
MFARSAREENICGLRTAIALGMRLARFYACHGAWSDPGILLFTFCNEMIATVRSMLVLVEQARLTDCPLLQRSVWETFVDLW